MCAIKAKKRDMGAKLEDLKTTGEIPAVFYGAGKKSTPISISKIEFKKIWYKAGESSAVEITMAEGKRDTLSHEVQPHPGPEEPIHVDFLVIDMNKKIKVNVPIEFDGVSAAVK